jgi:hypothetical protein
MLHIICFMLFSAGAIVMFTVVLKCVLLASVSTTDFPQSWVRYI